MVFLLRAKRGGGGLQRSCKTEGAALFDRPQDARGAALGALFEGAQEVEHAGVAGQQVGDGA